MDKRDSSFGELVSKLEASIRDVASMAKGSETESENLLEFGVLAEKFVPILDDLSDNDKAKGSSPMRKAVESLDKEFGRAKALIRSPNAREAVKQIEDLTHDLGRSLGLVLFARLDISTEIKQKISALHRELMNTNFTTSQITSSSTSSEMGFYSESEVEEEEDNIVEEERINLDINDLVLQLKYGDDDQLKCALLGLQHVVNGKVVNQEWISEHSIVPILINRLSVGKQNSRLTVMRILRTLASQDAINKEKMADDGSLSVLVKSLARDVEERREAVGLLLSLSDLNAVRRRIGRLQGCIVMLVAVLNSEDSIASNDACKLLNALSSNTQNALHMAEAGYFKPLVQYLKEGSDMSKILMASALSRMELTDQSKASLGEDGAINPLVKMFSAGKLEAKLSALGALHDLSSSTENIQRLVSSGIVGYLLQLLFSVTSVLMTLREPASAILARIAHSESALVNPEVAQQMLSLLNLSSPTIQCHLLQALNSIAAHPSASKVKRKMREKGAFQLLLPFLTESNPKIRTDALKLLYTLSKDSPEELGEQLGESHLFTLVSITATSISMIEKAAAVGILSNIPIADKKATDAMKTANLLPILLSAKSSSSATSTSTDQAELWLEESVAGVLIRFTIPSDKKMQHFSAEHGVILSLVKLLSSGSPLARARAANALAQLSQNSFSLAKSKRSRWLCVSPSSDALCEVHESFCKVKCTFCIVKAGAVAPLIHALEGKEREADEAVLDALGTLIQDDNCENGSNYLAKISGVAALIKVLESGNVKAQEKALTMLEKIFSIDEHRLKYGASAQMVLIDLAQTANSRLKSTAARILAQLELLQIQSSYF
ncbi:U-box domain-containing protein 44-like [Rhodamnia argentea]|uniref:U-box domain-containing protein 44-like n=1 Tax=Rhodamnia argentea TaxID=178133 RepID=A0A8B8PE03_9MYRT|nr:U-box domain-containing protein 44-like [Rhodamnia argentea]XP_048134851.1 U-box domain-containing protein 44-like [Rhodamnia argentea]XP_048134852.1 U-box domain-containing protein 44-like [Rhodamnia argentea]XP_048134853.1 U-box domain-containing protein 44-like [Rhodamnia argentea]